jgi:dTDP-L-rhamnose 4-epimerase
MTRVLITGGAGFIGSHLADALLAHGEAVRVLDVLDPQVHPDGARPDYLDPDVEFVQGDVRDAQVLARTLDDVDVVVHLAAAVGVGQSMYQIDRYVSVNDLGTATLLQQIIQRTHIRRLVVASSMSVYGEGQYVDAQGNAVVPQPRRAADLRRGMWELTDASGHPLRPVPTTEDKPVALTSVYAMTKYAQERLCLSVGEAYDIPTIALRFFNVYGSRQALSNPYTGVLAIFASRLLNGRRPMVYEDGRQQRDFVSVHDVADACRLAVDAPATTSGVFNVGSGCAISVADLASQLAQSLGKSDLTPEVTRRARIGDIRHCVADISAAREALSFAPRVTLDDGLPELVGWLETQRAVDRFAEASNELVARGLTA